MSYLEMNQRVKVAIPKAFRSGEEPDGWVKNGYPKEMYGAVGTVRGFNCGNALVRLDDWPNNGGYFPKGWIIPLDEWKGD
jgi:hypothetical protein